MPLTSVHRVHLLGSFLAPRLHFFYPWHNALFTHETAKPSPQIRNTARGTASPTESELVECALCTCCTPLPALSGALSNLRTLGGHTPPEAAPLRDSETSCSVASSRFRRRRHRRHRHHYHLWFSAGMSCLPLVPQPAIRASFAGRLVHCHR